VLVQNLLHVLAQPKLSGSPPPLESLPAKYFGYTSCPILLGQKKLMLAEFKYNAEINETFPIDQVRPNYFFYLLKRYLFPKLYWHVISRGYHIISK